MRAFVALVLLLIAPSALAQGTDRLLGSSSDVRTTLAFKVPDAAVQKVLPAGWEVNSPAAGPAKGSNLNVTLLEQIIAQDPEGKVVPRFRGVAVSIPAKKRGSDVASSMIIAGLMTPANVPGPYGTYVSAKVVVDRKQHTDADGKISFEESWEFKAEDGNSVEVQISYVRGTLVPTKTETKVYSAATGFYRIYRVEQIEDVARSIAAGIDRVGKFSFKAAGPKLAPLFDGSQQLISVTSIPRRSTTYLPGS